MLVDPSHKAGLNGCPLRKSNLHLEAGLGMALIFRHLAIMGHYCPNVRQQQNLPEFNEAKLEECFANTDKDLNAAIDNAIVDFLADTGTAFTVVGEESFIKLMKVANRKIKLKHRTTYSRLVKVKANEIRKHIHEIITAVKGDLTAVGFTTDMWTSCSGQPFMSLTCHFIDKDWELHR